MIGFSGASPRFLRPAASIALNSRHNPAVKNALIALTLRRSLNGVDQTDPTPNVTPVDGAGAGGKSPRAIPKGAWKGTAFKMAESALTTFASIAILG